MARSQSLLSTEPTTVVHQQVSISHVQLRDLIICPDERGVVNYVQEQCTSALSIPQLCPEHHRSLNIPDTNERLLAAGGQDAELHLSIHSRRNPSPRSSSDPASQRPTRRLWQYDNILSGSINNSVLLTSLSLTRSNESSAEPRVAVSNNDCTVKFFDVNVRGTKGVDGPPKRITEVGTLRLDVPVNHSSISPDGRTLLSVGDSPHVYLHGMTGGARITFTPLAQLTLPPFETSLSAHTVHNVSALPASFSTAFSPDGSKFAIASQEGMVAVWDVRSRKPMKVYTTDRSRLPPGGIGRTGSRPMGTASGWLYEDTWDWTMPAHRAPGWGVRNVKFSSGIDGKEIMTFTEHTSLLHVIDATTFEHEEIIRVPAVVGDHPPPPSSPRSSVPASPRSTRSSPAPVPQPSHPPSQAHVRTLAASLLHVSPPQPHLHTHPHGHGHYHHYHSAATLPPPPPPANDRDRDRDRDRRLRVRVRQRDVLLTAGIPSASASASVPTTPLLTRRRSSHVDGTEMDVDAEDDAAADADDMDDAEAETDCLTSRAPSRAPSPPLGRQPSRRPAAPSYFPDQYSTPDGNGNAGALLAIQTPAHLDLAGTCFDPSGAWLYVASTAGIVEWRVRGGEKRWWSESAWA
ncbi:WD40-repeat-containing domain protein [Lactarius quietus]|nr:WD40-repeat-containing domain protein [Lactarius quietus]